MLFSLQVSSLNVNLDSSGFALGIQIPIYTSTSVYKLHLFITQKVIVAISKTHKLLLSLECDRIMTRKLKRFGVLAVVYSAINSVFRILQISLDNRILPSEAAASSFSCDVGLNNILS